MDERPWFKKQLEVSGQSLIWSVNEIPPEHRSISPPIGLGEWSAMRHLWHMVYNETHVVLPRIKRWLGEPRPDLSKLEEEAVWQSLDDYSSIPDQFRAVRDAHIQLIDQLDPSIWDETKEVTLGPVNLRWVLTKSVQHSADHINEILRIALFWDYYAAQES